MQAFELTAIIDAQGTLDLPEECRPVFGQQARVIVFLEDSRGPGSEVATPALSRFAGLLRDSPNFNEDLVGIQRK